ncbi:zinc knuckle CX2CX4HX4C containing protein [Tanacetum coccineum]
MLDFNNALADLRASISIMPFSMYKLLGIGKLETIKMNIELADNSKCIPKGIVRNLLIKIDKFILPIDFIVLDVLEDFRMPVILGRPLLATTHAKVDVLKKSISLEVGNEKVIFKMRSDLRDMRNESVLMIKSNMIAEEDELMNIESDFFTYITNTCESCHILAVDTDLFTYEIERENHTGAPRSTDKIMGFKRADYDDNNDFYDPDQCWDGRNNEIRERIIHNLHEEWFKGTSDDENDIEGIIDYLEPTSYDGFIDLDKDEYNKSLGLREVYMKLEVSNMQELPRTGNNVATIRNNIMDEGIKSLREDGDNLKDFRQISNLEAMLMEFLILILLHFLNVQSGHCTNQVRDGSRINT